MSRQGGAPKAGQAREVAAQSQTRLHFRGAARMQGSRQQGITSAPCEGECTGCLDVHGMWHVSNQECGCTHPCHALGPQSAAGGHHQTARRHP